MSCEYFSTKEQKDISFYETHSSKPRLSDALVHRSFFRHFSFTVHLSLLIAPKPVSYVLMSNPFSEIGAICVSKNFGRCTQTSLPLITQNSPLIVHYSLLTTHYSKICRICVIGVPLSSFVKKEEKGILDRVKKIQKIPTLL